MTAELDRAVEIVQIALQYRELIQEGAVWSGGQVTAETTKLAARAVAQSLDAGILLRGITDSATSEETLRGLLAMIWAQGFNVGTMYAEKQGKR